MRAFVTGGTGFVGTVLVQQLRGRGDDVAALVRSADRAAGLRRLGAEPIPGDLSDEAAIARGVRGADAVVHLGAIYKVGVPESERPAMEEANVRGTERVLDAAVRAEVPRIVYVSTVNVFGNTHGRVVDETYERPEAEGFLSIYDETKYRAHQLARQRIAAGAPVLIAQPGGIYGPGDPSQLGTLIDQVRTGRLRFSSSRRRDSTSGSSRTWRPGSSSSTIAGGSARPTSWVGRSPRWER